MIGIKFHSIDMYQLRYANKDGPKTLEENVRDGHLLNDIQFFINEGLVESWKRNQTTIDRENKTISFRDGKDGSIRTVPYDYIVDGGRETPNLPPITYFNEDGLGHAYQYNYRESLFGVVPSRLNKNVFFLGFSRP